MVASGSMSRLAPALWPPRPPWSALLAIMGEWGRRVRGGSTYFPGSPVLEEPGPQVVKCVSSHRDLHKAEPCKPDRVGAYRLTDPHPGIPQPSLYWVDNTNGCHFLRADSKQSPASHPRQVRAQVSMRQVALEACGGPGTRPINSRGFAPQLQSLNLRPAGFLSRLQSHRQSRIWCLAWHTPAMAFTLCPGRQAVSSTERFAFDLLTWSP